MNTQNKKPEALRLAEILEEASFPEAYTDSAATELRRLHALNQELLEALELMRHAFLDTEGSHGILEQTATDAARAAIAKATGEQGG